MKRYGLPASALALALCAFMLTSAEAGVGPRLMPRFEPRAHAAPPPRVDRFDRFRHESRIAPRRQQQNQNGADFAGLSDVAPAPEPTPTPTNDAGAAPVMVPAYPVFGAPLEAPAPSSGPRIIEIGPQSSAAAAAETPTVIYGAAPLSPAGGPKIIYGDPPN